MNKHLLKNQKGSISIIGIILTLILVTVLGGFVSMNKNSWVASETQSIIDTSSINALNNSIDKEKLKREVFAIKGTNASINTRTNAITRDDAKMNTTIKNLFQTELNKQLKTMSVIKSINIKSFSSSLELSSWGITSYGTNKPRPQLVLDSMLEITIDNVEKFDNLGSQMQSYFDAKSGTNKVTVVNGTKQDGKIVLLVRCLSRISYR